MPVCPGCGTDNAADHRFCRACGSPLAAVCPSCGSAVASDQRFCGMCGHALAGGAAASPVVSAAERRVCSVLFADLVGFTPLSESRDPEQVRELLSQYFETTRTVISRYGGVVEKFIGDAVMAVWGTPIATEGDAERAVRAALDVVAAVSELGVQAGVEGLQARAGVVTGEVAVTIGATAEGMVAGDAVNTAARVQSTAAPGTVLVDSATQRLASTVIGFADAGEHELKGKREPLRLWRATRVVSGVGSQRVDGLEAPFIGRDAELRTVKELLHASAERRSPRLVLVSGPAGVGKTRLGWEFRKYVDGLAESIFWHQGRCLSYGDGVAYWALAEIVRQRFGIAEEDPTEVATAKLAERIAEFVPDPTEQAYVGPRLARLLGVSFAGGGEAALAREELFAGWRLFFERLADVRPVVVLVEDAQYADPAMLDFLDHLVDWARTSPIYVLVLARPELEERRPGWASGRNRTALTLDPLDPRSMDTLVDALVPGMPRDAVEAIAAQAQGNPLFAVETVRSLIDRDAILPVDGVYRLVGDVGELSVPDSLHALLAARLDALDPGLRSLVADAAVLGTSFPVDALVAVSGQDPATVDTALAELLRREVFEITADPLSPQRGAYHFSQNLLRQVAYETLSRRDRKARHLAVAAHLRATFAGDGEEVSDVLARHYLDAREAVPEDPDAAELGERAIAALVRAAERALASGAPARAGEAFAHAAQLTEDAGGGGGPTPAATLWDRAADAATDATDWITAVERADHATALFAAAGDDRAAACSKVTAARPLRRSGRHTEARARLDAALAVLGPERDHGTLEALMEKATLETFAGGSDAHRLSSEAIELGEELGAGPEVLAQLFIARGLAAGFNNRFAEAEADLEYAARIAERAGDSLGVSRARLNLASTMIAADPTVAAASSRVAVDRARQLGDRYFLPTAISNLVVSQMLLGEWDEAVAVVDSALRDDELGDDLHSAYVSVYAAILAAMRGEEHPEAALRPEVAAAIRASEDPQDLAGIAVMDTMIAVSRADLESSLRSAQEVLLHAEPLGFASECLLWAWPVAIRAADELDEVAVRDELMAALDAYPLGHLPPLVRAERDLAHARRAAATGDQDAEGAFVTAVDELRAFGSPYHLALGLLDHARHLSGLGQDSAVATLLDEARQIAVRLGARPLLALVAAVGAREHDQSTA